MDAATLRRVAEGLHDVVAQEVGQQNDQLRARRQLQRFLLMRGITAADVMRDRNVVSFEQIRNITQSICPNHYCTESCRHDEPHWSLSLDVMIMIPIF